MRARLQLLAAAAALLACTGAIDTADRVHDLRMLAMRADPPEVTLPVAFLPDGGVVSRGPLPALPPVSLTGLIADPAGGGRAVDYEFAICSARDSETARCEDDSPGYRVLAEGQVAPTPLGAEPTVTFTPTWEDLSGAVVEDPYHGFGGLPVALQLEVSAGGEAVVGIKRVVFTASLTAPLPPPNQNPALDAVTYAGADWAEGASAAVDFNGEVHQGFRGATVTSDNPIEVFPTASLFEDYDRTAFDGSTIHFSEVWRYSFFATAGSFSPANAGGNAGPPGTQPDQGPVSAKWVPDLGETGGPTTVWIVVRDGRGGETWTVRQANAPSLPGGP
ncbi:MAG TPA: hypothetical protein VFA20_11760 [Myxococcaceae bacterium]|nr:hypothetical protein [Myxococcaceae bacterium]